MFNNTIPKSKFRVGDRVISKKTGLPASGTIINVQYAKYYRFEFYRAGKPDPLETHQLWNELYPDWGENNVYIINMDEPMVPLTYEEYKKSWVQNNGETKDEIIRYAYNNIPKQNFIVYPEEDLEEFKEDICQN